MSHADYLRALHVELDGYVATGRDDRADQVRAEIKRVSALVDTPSDDSAAPADTPEDDAVADPPPAKRRPPAKKKPAG